MKATNFTPLVGEIIVYDPDENYDYPRIKIGDGETNINSLPFITEDYAKIADIPTKPADIGAQPAGNYLTSIPSEYVTESELNAKGYLTDYTESDPTVPAWAKASSKPAYTAAEVGAVSQEDLEHSIDEALEEAKKNGEFDGAAGKTAYEYAKEGGYAGTEAEFAEKLAEEYPTKLSQFQNDSGFITGYTETDPTVPAWAKEKTKPSYSKSEVGLGNVDNVRQYSASNPPPYPVVSVNSKTGKVQLGAADVGARPSNWMPTAQEVGALPDTYVPPNQTAAQVGADPAGTAAAAVSAHNTSTESHGDLRLELKAIDDRLTAFFDSDNKTLDELSEIVSYITSNKALIDSITTSKVSVADIINNLTTNVANKPLSAAQGVALKGLIDAVSNSLSNYQPKGDYALRSELPTVPTKVSQLENDKGYLTEHQDISGKVDKVGLTLGRHADGLLYVFVDGQPVGNGVDLPAGGIDGYITPDKQIVFNNLPDGEYTLAYINDDGSIVPIGAMEKDTNVYYTITNNLTQCTNSNSTTQAVQGESYSATISVNDGYELSSVMVTMGGTDISSTAVSGGKITIANVTGDIVITATATEIQTEPAEPTNFAEPNTTNKTDWSIWCNDARFGSDGAYRALTGKNNVVTNYVAMEVGDIIRFEGLNVATTGQSMNNGIHFSDANKTMTSCSYLEFYTSEKYDYLTVTVTDGVYEIDTAKLVKHSKAKDSKYFRISGTLTGTLDDVVINVKRNGAWL